MCAVVVSVCLTCIVTSRDYSGERSKGKAPCQQEGTTAPRVLSVGLFCFWQSSGMSVCARDFSRYR